MRKAVVGFALIALACGGTNYGDLPAGSETQVSRYWSFEPAWPELYVAMVDDRPDATDLRATTARTFDQLDEQILESTASCQPRFDPAAFHPIDRSFVVVHPSAAPEDRYTSALDMPALSWHADQRTDVEHAAWSAAVTAALEPKQSVSGAFAALDASEQVLSLLGGSRAPESDEESAILERMSVRYARSILFYMLAHDDESDGDPESFAVPLGDNTVFSVGVLPAAKPASTPVTCFGPLPNENNTARYAAWLKAQGFYFDDLGHWPCSDATFYPAFAADCGGNCLEFAPAVEPDGSARCTITATLYDDEPCNAAFGWLDPLGSDGTRAPRVVNDNGTSRRVCEIRQLDGAALASCVSNLECPDCEPGWCATQVPDLLDQCENGKPNQFRFVGGADRATWGLGEVRCDVAL
jgi:hypothetical protein